MEPHGTETVFPFFLSFFLSLPIPLETLGCLRLYFSWLLQQLFGYPLSSSLSETETRPSRLHWWFYLKKALAALSLSLASSTAGVQARPLSYNAPNVTT